MLAAARRVARWTPGPRWLPAAAAGALALAVSLSGVAATAPYYLSYFNPMLGGTPKAPDAMMVGWGEGLDQVAEFLNGLPEGAEIVASTEAWRTPLAYFLDGDAKFAAFVDDPPGVFRWANSDYYILYVTPLTRNGVWPPFLAYIEGQEPVLTVTLNGLEYARVYEIRDDPMPPYMEAGGAGMVIWQGLGRMVAVGKAENPGAERGTEVREIFYFDHLTLDNLDAIRDRFGLRLQLISPDGQVVAVSEGPLELREPVRHELFWTERSVMIPADAERGSYQLTAQVYDVATGALVPGFSSRYGDRLGETMTIDSVFVVGSQAELDALPELT
jgi:hypothetical protein